jgi:hypothetical protein
MIIILVHSTGRSGTALIANYFGGTTKEGKWMFRNNTAIAHEPFEDLEGYHTAISDVKSGRNTNICEVVEKKIKEIDIKGYDTLLITDNKLGRWFYNDLFCLGVKIRIIYLYRNENDVIKSLKRTNTKQSMWWAYQPSDKDALTDRTIDPFWFHVKETAARWQEKRKRLKAGDYIEILFERFLEDRKYRKKLEKFVGLRGNENILGKKINYSLPFLRDRFYSDISFPRYVKLVFMRIKRKYINK